MVNSRLWIPPMIWGSDSAMWTNQKPGIKTSSAIIHYLEFKHFEPCPVGFFFKKTCIVVPSSFPSYLTGLKPFKNINYCSRIWTYNCLTTHSFFCHVLDQLKTPLSTNQSNFAVYGGFLKWWYPATMGVPTKNDQFGVWNGGYHHLRKHPYCFFSVIPSVSSTAYSSALVQCSAR